MTKSPAVQYRKPKLPYWGIEKPEHEEDGFSIDRSFAIGTVYFMGTPVAMVSLEHMGL